MLEFAPPSKLYIRSTTMFLTGYCKVNDDTQLIIVELTLLLNDSGEITYVYQIFSRAFTNGGKTVNNIIK